MCEQLSKMYYENGVMIINRPRKDDIVISQLGNYTMENYHDLIDEHCMDCPYYYDDEQKDNFVSHIWGTYAARMPGSKTRLVDYFADNFVDDPVIAAKIRRTKQIMVDMFEVLDCDYDRGRFVLRAKRTGTKYKTVAGPSVTGMLKKGDKYECMIHPWEEDGTYNLGAVISKEPLLVLRKPVDEL